MKNVKNIVKITATFAILFSFATIVAIAATAIINPLDAYGDWPKTVMYQPRDAEGQTGLTIAQCDSPEQCKEVNGTPSPNLAAKKQCEEFSSEKCKKVK
jgi:hypothetical protein